MLKEKQQKRQTVMIVMKMTMTTMISTLLLAISNQVDQLLSKIFRKNKKLALEVNSVLKNLNLLDQSQDNRRLNLLLIVLKINLGGMFIYEKQQIRSFVIFIIISENLVQILQITSIMVLMRKLGEHIVKDKNV